MLNLNACGLPCEKRLEPAQSAQSAPFVLSLFPGIGLLDTAFEEEGFVVVRGPDVLWGGDIRRFHPPAGKFDGVIGGPPCQSFSSLVHLVRANGHEPKFGNLIPEFERCVSEAEPAWFVMEEVRAAPVPSIEGYAVKDFLLNNAWIAGDDWLGQEQERLRRFTFGIRGPGPAPSLLQWIDIAALMLPEGDRSGSVIKEPVRSDPVSKRRHECVTGGNDKPPSVRDRRSRQRTVTALGTDHLDGLAKSTQRVRSKMILGNGDPCCVAIGGSGKVKPAVRSGAVTGSDGGKSVRMARYKLPDACRLQGLPEDFMAETPFRKDAALKMIANGVPKYMGRAIARAVKEAIGREPA